jgi:hypothetical protein
VTHPLIDELFATACTLGAVSDWDHSVYERAFTESPAEQLRNSNPRRVLLTALEQPEFRQALMEIANDDDVEPSDVIRSLHRTLSEYHHEA